MIKKYFFGLCLIVGCSVQAQIVNIPDANFKAKLLESNVNSTIAKDINGNNIKIDVNNNGEIDQNEALLVYKLFTPDNSAPPFRISDNVVPMATVVNPITDLTGIAAFSNLIYLNVSSNQLASMDVTTNVALKELNCSYNLLNALDLTGLINLEKLVIDENEFTTFSTAGLPALKSFSCAGNQITSLAVNTSTQLEGLYCTSNLLTSLDIANLTNLKALYISDNPLGSVDLSPFSQLLSLKCYNNGLTSLDLSNQSALTFLDCNTNQITSLDLSNMTALENLSCYTNAITNLNFSANPNIKVINCSYNSISDVTFGNNPLLTNFNGIQNLFQTLDFSNTGIRKVSCSDNPNLTFVNVKNGFVSEDIYNEPPLPWPFYNFHMDNLPALTYICHDEGEFGPVLVEHIGLENVSRGTYCSFAPGGSYNTITGTVRLDCGGANTTFANQKIKVNSGTQIGYTYTNNSGNYIFYAAIGNVVVTPQMENEAYFTVSPANYSFDFTTTGNTESADFCLMPNGTHPDLEISLLPITPARPGFDAQYKIVFKNKGNQIQSGTVHFGFDDAISDFVSASPNVTSQTAAALTWDFTNLYPSESRSVVLTLNINSPMEIPAVNNGDILNYSASIVSSPTDETPDDNQTVFNQTVVGSFDPNDKMVLEGTQISMTQANDYLHYMVRFQNTGTFAAENVVVKDILSNQLDWNSLEMISSSHAYRSTLINGNQLEVFYENINLPPSSSDEPVSHGYIAFKIKPKTGIAVDDVIENTANIYFDFNFPIVTNTVSTTVTALGIHDANQSIFSVYPNPTANFLQLVLAENNVIKEVTIYNTLGQKLITLADKTVIDVSALSKGTYLITVQTDKGQATRKFIKM